MRPEAFSHADSPRVWPDAPDAPADEVEVSLPDGPAGEAAAAPDAELDALLVFRQDAEPVAAKGEAGPPAWPPTVELGAGLVAPQVWPWDATLDVRRVWRWSAARAAYSGLGAHSGLAAHWYGLPLLPGGRWWGFPALLRDVGLWDSG